MDPRPKLRGVIHQWAAPVAAGAGLVLVGMAPTVRAARAAAAFAASLVALFSISATYHRVTWKPAARAWMRRLDHASIFVLIAGTYTPILAVTLSSETGSRLLAMVWTGAFVGIAQSLWASAPRVLTAGLSVFLGWIVIPYLGEVRDALTVTEMVLILSGGVAYTIGALAYALKRPRLSPSIFGYHELFHACTILGAVSHFVAVMMIVRGAAPL